MKLLRQWRKSIKNGNQQKLAKKIDFVIEQLFLS